MGVKDNEGEGKQIEAASPAEMNAGSEVRNAVLAIAHKYKLTLVQMSGILRLTAGDLQAMVQNTLTQHQQRHGIAIADTNMLDRLDRNGPQLA